MKQFINVVAFCVRTFNGDGGRGYGGGDSGSGVYGGCGLAKKW